MWPFLQGLGRKDTQTFRLGGHLWGPGASAREAYSSLPVRAQGQGSEAGPYLPANGEGQQLDYSYLPSLLATLVQQDLIHKQDT